MQTEAYRTKDGRTLYRPVFKRESAAMKYLDGGGFCLTCKRTRADVEPDARKYTCQCGAQTLYGVAELFIMGVATIKG